MAAVLVWTTYPGAVEEGIGDGGCRGAACGPPCGPQGNGR